MASHDSPSPHRRLLAIDLGHRAGFAVYTEDGRLESYRPTNFGSRSRMKSAAWGVLSKIDGLTQVVAEGDRTLAEIFEKVAAKQGVAFRRIDAEQWRPDLLLARQRRSGTDAKDAADAIARDIIAWSGAPAPTSLRHDAAEAVCIGLWAVLWLGWLGENPVE